MAKITKSKEREFKKENDLEIVTADEHTNELVDEHKDIIENTEPVVGHIEPMVEHVEPIITTDEQKPIKEEEIVVDKNVETKSTVAQSLADFLF